MIIAQVSDTHIKKNGKLAYKKVDTKKALEKCINHINTLVNKPDIVIFSGDLVDSGDIKEYEVFNSLIQKLEIPYYIIPGNHDNISNMKKIFKNQIWDKKSKFLNFVLESFPLIIIGLDSTCKNENYGMLCKERLIWLETQIKKHQDKKIIIFMHHPPINIGINHMDIQNLKIGSEKLAKLTNKYKNILNICCGHVHRTSFTFWENTIVSTVPSCAHQVALDLNKNSKPLFILEPPSIHLHYYENNTLTTHTSIIDDYEGPYPFYDENGDLID